MMMNRSHLKIRIFGRDQDEAEDQPAPSATGSSRRIRKYVEDLRRGPNADIGRKDIFEMASNLKNIPILTSFFDLTRPIMGGTSHP